MSPDYPSEGLPAPSGRAEPGGAIAAAWGALLGWLSRFNGLALLLLAVMISADIAFRWATGRPILGVFEFSEILFVIITFLAVAQAQFTGQQLRIDALSGRARGRAAGALGALDAMVGLAFFGVLLWTSSVDWWEALRGGFLGRGMLQIPTAIPLGFILLGTALMVVTLLIVLGRALRLFLAGNRHGAEPERSR